MPTNSQANTILFVTCMTSLVLCFISLFFAVYVFFDLYLGWVTNPPAFIYIWEQWLINQRLYSQGGADFLILVIWILAALVFGLLSFITSKKVEREEGLIPELDKELDTKKIRETMSFGGKVFLIIIGILFVVLLVQRNFFGF